MNLLEWLNTINTLIELVTNLSELTNNIHIDKMPNALFLFAFNINNKSPNKNQDTKKKLS